MTEEFARMTLPTADRQPPMLLHVHTDPHTNPILHDIGVDALEGFVAQRWQYVTVLVRLAVNGVHLESYRTGVPCGDLPSGNIDIHHLAHVEPGPVLAVQCRAQLAALTIELASLALATETHVPVALTRDDLADIRNCLHNAARRWREAINDAEAASKRPQQTRSAPPGYLDVEPTPAGYLAAAHLFRGELSRVSRLVGMFDRMADKAHTAADDDSHPR